MSSEWKKNVVRRFGGQSDVYDDYSAVQEKAAATLLTFLPEMDAPDVLEIGCGTGVLTGHLFEKYQFGSFRITDISEDMIASAIGNLNDRDNGADWRVMDGEHPNTDRRYDLIVSNMSVQWFENLEAGLARLRGLLKPGGVVLYSMPGPESFKEWRSVLSDLDLASGILNFSCRPDVFERTEYMQHYDDALDFLRHIKRIGAHTPHVSYKPLCYKDFKAACRDFDEKYKGRVSWEILYGRIDAKS